MDLNHLLACLLTTIINCTSCERTSGHQLRELITSVVYKYVHIHALNVCVSIHHRRLRGCPTSVCFSKNEVVEVNGKEMVLLYISSLQILDDEAIGYQKDKMMNTRIGSLSLNMTISTTFVPSLSNLKSFYCRDQLHDYGYQLWCC